jgi:hypothetical protein
MFSYWDIDNIISVDVRIITTKELSLMVNQKQINWDSVQLVEGIINNQIILTSGYHTLSNFEGIVVKSSRDNMGFSFKEGYASASWSKSKFKILTKNINLK